MKQVVQSLMNGEIRVVEVPVGEVPPGHVMVRTSRSLISAGTERMLVEFGKGGWFEKARQQPEKVKQAWAKVQTDGIAATLGAIRTKLDQPFAVGYCNVGTVIAVGDGVHQVKVGDRVASNAAHAEIVLVPINLCARVPDNVTDDQAAFTVLGAIGLQGIRLIAPGLGETVAVIGLGLIGLLAVQLLRAHGCQVLGFDPNGERCALARSYGARVIEGASAIDRENAAIAASGGRGADAVLITASTSSNDPVKLASVITRQRGRIVLVGVAGLELSRAEFYRKELNFQVSCSYGPGRYDPVYEEGGIDYPFGLVRWTEQRNFEAVLNQLSHRALTVDGLISHRFKLDRANEAYDLLTSAETSLGILLEHNEAQQATPVQKRVVLRSGSASRRGGRLAVIGAGNYAGRVLIPALQAAGAELATLVSAKGLSAVHYGNKYGFEEASTDVDSILRDDSISSVVIATRHDSHARLVVDALNAGKRVYVEKPLCTKLEELASIESALSAYPMPFLMIGFNRRFSPLAKKAHSLLKATAAPKVFLATINAGYVAPQSWINDSNVGGGRLVGEACHFIDLLRFLAGSPIRAIHVEPLGGSNAGPSGNATVTLTFADGSTGTVHYLSNGHPGVEKERLEVFCAGKILKLVNFRSLYGFGWSGFSAQRGWRQDKGQKQCAEAFVAAIRAGAPPPIPIDELMEVSRFSIMAQLQADGRRGTCS
jgi:predicted dehydrogenase/threonine dehydrogenase-like Zn-dependent dehydrogenase